MMSLIQLHDITYMMIQGTPSIKAIIKINTSETIGIEITETCGDKDVSLCSLPWRKLNTIGEV
jgi:hypothetical protein